ncbi:HNH endonuclease [Streptomyces sp. NBC_00932]|uniref:HNH endonuclease n=1 Tax=Streptomyces sp. NBC_00932 TaxID=2903690 RepID=UPI00386C17EF|nr:HNH endonuclease [Streptomyces sp. NBC_00932]
MALYTGEDRARSGDLYDDVLGERYSWDSTVPNHATVAVGDIIVLWNGETLLGISALESIKTSSGVKDIHRCPQCQNTEVNPRKTLTPLYRCANTDCNFEFDVPVKEPKEVTRFRGTYEPGWVDMAGALSGRELRQLCVKPRSQNSFRELKWDAVHAALAGKGEALPLGVVEKTEKAIAGGHSTATVRVRRGQANFRKKLLDTYGETCAFSGPTPAVVLEAAHLYSYADTGDHNGGGFLLRRDLHRLFDLGLIAIRPDTLALDVATDVHGYPLYKCLHDQPLAITALSNKQRTWIATHWQMHREP